MSNPFIEDEITDRYLNHPLEGTFIEHVSKQISHAVVGKAISIDRAGRDFITSRSTLRVAAIKLGFKFVTKTGSNNELWALRVL